MVVCTEPVCVCEQVCIREIGLCVRETGLCVRETGLVTVLANLDVLVNVAR